MKSEKYYFLYEHRKITKKGLQQFKQFVNYNNGRKYNCDKRTQNVLF